MAEAAGVERRYFGSFTERAFWIEMIKIESGVEWISTSENARRLTVVLSGSGSVEGTEIGRLGAIEADPGEKLHVAAAEEMVLYIVGLLPIGQPAVPSDQFDIIRSDGGIRFEDPAQSDTA